jgi:hypothetical protein
LKSSSLNSRPTTIIIKKTTVGIAISTTVFIHHHGMVMKELWGTRLAVLSNGGMHGFCQAKICQGFGKNPPGSFKDDHAHGDETIVLRHSSQRGEPGSIYEDAKQSIR